MLLPLPYHVAIRDYLHSEEPDVWKWFSSVQAQTDYTESLRLELLKSTYRLDAASHPDIYQSVEEAKAALSLDVPVTVYQAQHAPQPNAALYFIPSEGHLVLSGPIVSLLTTTELKSVIGHELAHYHLWHRDNGDFHIADRVLQAIAQDARADYSHVESARRFQLYTEIFADRGSLVVTNDIETVIGGLVKIQTGLSQVSAASYLKQAEEIFAKSKVKTSELSHPEGFIRARSLALWAEQKQACEPEIQKIIEGLASLDQLDVLQRVGLTRQTRHLVEMILRPKWMRSEAMLAHAKLFFSDVDPAASTTAGLGEWNVSDAGVRDYLCYLLLDFVVADPELDEMPLFAALELSKKLEIDSAFEKLLTKELKLKAKDLKRLKDQSTEMLAKAEAAV